MRFLNERGDVGMLTSPFVVDPYQNDKVRNGAWMRGHHGSGPVGARSLAQKCQLGAHHLTEILPDHFLNVQADHLKDLLRLTLNLFEKADNFGYIDARSSWRFSFR